MLISNRQGTIEEMAVLKLFAGKAADVVVEYTNTKPASDTEADISQPALMRGVVSDNSEFVM